MSSASSESDLERYHVPFDSARHKIRKSRKRRDATHQQENHHHSEDDCLADNEMGCKSSKSIECGEGDEEEDIVTTTTVSGDDSYKDVSLIRDALTVAKAKNKSFSEFQVREIERKNAILMSRIISSNRKPSQYRAEPVLLNKISNSQVNRKKKQQQIDRENMILLKKIQSVKPFGLSKRK